MTALARISSNCKRRTILSSERNLHKDDDGKGSIEKRIDGRDAHGLWCQDELIGGKPPVVK
jgi:hypothetical protein